MAKDVNKIWMINFTQYKIKVRKQARHSRLLSPLNVRIVLVIESLISYSSVKIIYRSGGKYSVLSPTLR